MLMVSFSKNLKGPESDKLKQTGFQLSDRRPPGPKRRFTDVMREGIK